MAEVDYEKAHGPKVDTTTSHSGHSNDADVIDGMYSEKPSLATRMGISPESFKKRTLADKHNQLNKTLQTRHLHMIAIGGSIGAGLFVGSGSALSNGGPASVIICFSIIGVMMINVVYALGELALLYPISGGFYTYSARFIDPSWGFAMGWNYVFQWAIVLPLELTVAALTINYWDTGLDTNTLKGIFITVFMVAIVIVNVFGVLGYAEEEFWVALLKLFTIVIFMFMALVFVLGGGPSSGEFDTYQGAKTWYNPGAFNNGFLGFCGVFVTAAFSFSGTELVGLAAAETEDPQKSLPGAIKQVFWRITLFYILSLFFVGLLVPYDDPRLFGTAGYIDVSASPFVIASVRAGVPAFGDFINVVILLAVVSIGMSGVFGGSRTLTALAEQGYAPKIFAYIDRAGRPLWSTVAIIAFGPIAYISLAAAGSTVFDWLLALSGLAALFTWGSICLAHIRFRSAWKYHGHTLDEIPFKAIGGVWGSWLGLFLVAIVLIAQLYTAIAGAISAADEEGGQAGAEAFFKSYLALFVVILFYVIGYVWKREAWIPTKDIDVDSGRREINWEAFEAENARKANWSKWRRAVDRVI